MKIKLIILSILICLWPSLMMAQSGFTSVTATVVDSNGTAYVNAPYSVTFYDPGTSGKLPLLNGSTFQKSYNGIATNASGVLSISLPDNSIIASSSGATGTQWIFSICSVPYTSPNTQFCIPAVTITISGASQNISSLLTSVAPILPIPGSNIKVNGSLIISPNFNSASPSADPNFISSTYKVSGASVISESPFTGGLNQYIAAQSCTGLFNCTVIKADLQAVNDPVFTAASNLLSSASATFTVNDVGKMYEAYSGCNASNELYCTVGCPQGTISGFTDAHHITLSGNCTNNSTAGAKSNNFVWSSDDAAALLAADTAAVNNTTLMPTTLFLPCANIGISAPSLTFINVNQAYNLGIQGCPGSTQITMFENANCNPAGTFHGCLLDNPFIQDVLGDYGFSDRFSNIIFNGYGQPDKGASATYSNPAFGVTCNGGQICDNIIVEGWNSQRNLATPVYGINCYGGNLLFSTSYAGGNPSMIGQELVAFPCSIHGGGTGGSLNNGLVIGAGLTSTFGLYFNQNQSSVFSSRLGYSVYNPSGTWRSSGDNITEGVWTEGSGVTDISNSTLSGASAVYDFVSAGGVTNLTNVSENGNCNITGGVVRIHAGVNTPSLCPTGVTQSGGTILYDPQTVGNDVQVAKASAQTAKTLFTVGNTTALFRVHVSVECTTTSAAATVTPSVIYTDTSGTVQTVTGSAATCTTLNASSVTSQDVTFRAKTATNIQYQTVIANTPTYDINVVVEQLSLN